MINNLGKKEAIIFDFDGVLYDSISLVREDLNIKYPTLEESDFMKIFEGDFWDGIQKIKDKYGEAKFSNTSSIKIAGKLFNNIPELINKLKDDYVLFINSSSKIANILEPLERYKINEYFKGIYGKESGINKIEKFKNIFNEHNLNPEKTIFITDSIGDIKDADILNTDTIAVTWGIHKETDFKNTENVNVIGIVNTVQELEKMLIKK